MMSVAPLQFLAPGVRGLGEPPPGRGHRVPLGGEPWLREQLGGRRLRFTDGQRRRLAAKGRAIGRRALAQFAGVVTPDTIFRWYRELIANVSDRPTPPGRGDFPGGGRDTLRGLSDRPHARLITAAPGCRVDVGDIRPSRPSARELSECRAECRRSVATRLPAMRQQVRKIT